MTFSLQPWHQRIVQLGRRRAQFLITLFSVAVSQALTAIAFWVFDGQQRDIPAFFLPALLIPMTVAPLASRWVIDAAIALDAAYQASSVQAAQLADILATAPVGVAYIGPDLTVRRTNDMAQSLLTLDANQRVDGPRLFVEPDEWRALQDAITHERRLQHARWRWQTAEGGIRLVRGHVAPLRGAQGTSAGDGSVFLFEDITDLAALEAQVVRTQHLDLAGRLAGGMAHDFNNLLTVIRASAESLGRGGEVQVADVQAIEDAANRGARLTRRLLAISRRDVYAPVVQGAAPLITETVDLMRRVLPPAVQIVAPERMPDVGIETDRDALQQAIMNLIINAQDALGGSGQIRLSAKCERDASNTEWLVVGVHDNGPGMTPQVLARATEPFFSTKPPHLGTGLGLSIVADTMQRHGGRLELTSVEGRGTVVWLWIPVSTRERPVTPVSVPAVRPPSAPSGLQLLLVEDEPDVRQTTERVLRRLGHSVTAVASMPEALAWLRSGERPDVIVSDVMMPGGTGIDLLHALRADGLLTPMLLVSGFAADAVTDALGDDPRAGFLGKPWTVHELQQSLQTLLTEPAGAETLS